MAQGPWKLTVLLEIAYNHIGVGRRDQQGAQGSPSEMLITWGQDSGHQQDSCHSLAKSIVHVPLKYDHRVLHHWANSAHPHSLTFTVDNSLAHELIPVFSFFLAVSLYLPFNTTTPIHQFVPPSSEARVPTDRGVSHTFVVRSTF